ncbi:MAG: hypothetical protein ACOX1L_08890 [Erysipelotrichaceae bacterium]|jgi:hypothetical protein
MNKTIRSALEETFPDLDNYKTEIDITDKFFKDRGISDDKLDQVFWNHMISLWERIDKNEQNDLEIENMEEFSKEAKNLLEEYILEVSKHRNFEINNFEKMLVAIYMQRMQEEEK